MKRFTLATTYFAILTLTNLSCSSVDSRKDDDERPGYFDLKVGQPVAKAEEFFEAFRKKNPPEGESIYPAYKHKLAGDASGGYYYSTFVYNYAPLDTVVHTVKVYYFIKPVDADSIMNSEGDGNRGSVIYDFSEKVSPDMILIDVLGEFESKYGAPDATDTLHSVDPLSLSYKWKDKMGANVTLDCSTLERKNNGKPVIYYHLKLEFTLTDELMKKLVHDNSIY